MCKLLMKIGERIKLLRKEKGISVEKLADILDVSKTTIYRYEDSTITKIPVENFNKICKALGVTPAQLMGNTPSVSDHQELPSEFKDAKEAMEFILKTPTLAAFGGYDPTQMSEEQIVEFANEILNQIKVVSYKYKYQNEKNWRHI